MIYSLQCTFIAEVVSQDYDIPSIERWLFRIYRSLALERVPSRLKIDVILFNRYILSPQIRNTKT